MACKGLSQYLICRRGGTWMDCCLRSYFLPHAGLLNAEVHFRIFGTCLRATAKGSADSDDRHPSPEMSVLPGPSPAAGHRPEIHTISELQR